MPLLGKCPITTAWRNTGFSCTDSHLVACFGIFLTMPSIPTLSPQHCMFRKSFKTDKTPDLVTFHKQTWRRLGINYIQITHILDTYSPTAPGLAHTRSFFHDSSPSVPPLSTLAGTETFVCLLGHETPKSSCLGLVLLPGVLAATTALTPKSS